MHHTQVQASVLLVPWPHLVLYRLRLCNAPVLHQVFLIVRGKQASELSYMQLVDYFMALFLWHKNLISAIAQLNIA